MPSILICSTPVHGHVTPLLAVARHLTDSGHRVRFLSGARYREAIEATGAQFLQLPPDADFDDTDVDAAFPGRVGKSGIAGIRYDLSTIFLRPAPSQLAAVDAAIAAERTDAILVESMFMGSLALLARGRDERPPVVNLGIVPLGIASVDTAPFGLGIPPKPGTVGIARNRVLRFITQRFIFGGLHREAKRVVRESTGRDIRGFFMDSAASADAIVQFSVADFEYPRRDLPETVHFVGPVSRTTPSSGELPDWWDELDGSRPVVHVTQGTVANSNYDELIVPTMTGLADEDVLVVVSTGGRPIGSLPSPLPQNVRVSSYLPYDKLLPLTDVFVSNGGYGGVHYAMEHGVPLVVAGTTEDKVEVTARVAWSGVGVNLSTNHPSAEQVRQAVTTVLGNDRHRAASARIGAEIANSSGLDGLARVIDDLIGDAASADTPHPTSHPITREG